MNDDRPAGTDHYGFSATRPHRWSPVTIGLCLAALVVGGFFYTLAYRSSDVTTSASAMVP